MVRTLLETWPKKEYLMHLAGLYGERDALEPQLALVEAAYDAGWLDDGSELASYASLLLAAEIPFKAANVLEAGLEAGTVEPSEQSYRMLGQAWRLAQEDERALPALRRAAELAEDGRVYLQLAGSYSNLARPEACVEAARAALERGLEQPAEAHLTLGACLAEAGRHEEALAALDRAARDPERRDLANDYITYVESEIDLRRRLDEALAELGESP